MLGEELGEVLGELRGEVQGEVQGEAQGEAGSILSAARRAGLFRLCFFRGRLERKMGAFFGRAWGRDCAESRQGGWRGGLPAA